MAPIEIAKEVREKLKKLKTESERAQPKEKLFVGRTTCDCNTSWGAAKVKKHVNEIKKEITTEAKTVSSVKQIQTSKYETQHHIPPQPFTYTPANLLEFGIVLDPIQRKIRKPLLNVEQLGKQIDFWFDDKYPTRIINSLKIRLITKAPYEDFDWDQNCAIGIFKRTGTTEGQCINISLAEAQVLIKLFIFLVEEKMREVGAVDVTGTRIPRFQFDYKPKEFYGYSFLDVGISRDYVVFDDQKLEKPDPGFIHDRIVKQTTSEFYVEKESSYDIGSVQVVATVIGGKRHLYGITKTSGVDVGQRIWFSIHELQHMIRALAYFEQEAIEILRNEDVSDQITE